MWGCGVWGVRMWGCGVWEGEDVGMWGMGG